MNGVKHAFRHIVAFYVDGFRQMTLGRTLWIIVLLKLFVIFVVLRLVFFKPAMQGLTPTEKQTQVAANIQK